VKLDTRILHIACLFGTFLAGLACGQSEPNRPDSRSVVRPAQENEDGRSLQGTSMTDHAIVVGGATIDYKATAGYLPVRGESDRVVADIFFVAYERQDATPPGTDRPITFAFNGGPGSSAVWLHMGGVGPKRAPLADNGTALPPSDTLVDNDYTWLEFTDLVFVDPVGSGFSRAAPGVDAKKFYEVRQDIELASDFVRTFVTEHERWLSPRYIAGESYGTARAVGMARYLQDHYGLYIDGLVLLSSALNMGAISFDPGNDLPYVLSLPSYAAAARYHAGPADRSLRDFDKTQEKVKAWALQEYISVLARGSSLAESEFRQAADKLAEYTGLPDGVITADRLRISNGDFIEELLRSQGRVLGLLDSRVTMPDLSSGGRSWTDPSLFVAQGPFVAAFNDYIRTELGFKTDLPYVFLSEQANRAWNWGEGKRGYLNIAPALAEAMSLDNRLRVFNAAGYYDLTTPYLSQEYVLDHLGLPSNLRSNITFRVYHSGHQIYTSTDALRQLTSDVRAFMAGSDTRFAR
jgi:carboxypeptidase C (cathepsin A)